MHCHAMKSIVSACVAICLLLHCSSRMEIMEFMFAIIVLTPVNPFCVLILAHCI